MYQYFFFLIFFLLAVQLVGGILVLWPGIKPGSWQWKHGVLTTGWPGNSQYFFLLPNNIPLYGYTTFYLFIHHWGTFGLLPHWLLWIRWLWTFRYRVFVCLFFWLCWVFVAAHRLSLVAASGGYSSLWCAGFSLWWLLLLRSTGSRHASFSSYGSRALEHRLRSCGAWT